MGRNGPHTWVLGVLVPMLGPIVTGVTPTYMPTPLEGDPIIPGGANTQILRPALRRRVWLSIWARQRAARLRAARFRPIVNPMAVSCLQRRSHPAQVCSSLSRTTIYQHGSMPLSMPTPQYRL